MATTQLAPAPVFRSWDNNGNPLYAGQLFTYAAGTTTPQTTWTDSTGNTPNANPVILNSRGEAGVWLNPSQAYKFVLEDSLGNLIWSVDNITSPIIQIPYGSASGTNAITVNTSPSFGTVTDGLFFQFKATNTNTSLATLNANSTAPYNLYYSDGVTQIAPGAIIQNMIYGATFDSSLNSGAGGYVIENPSRITGSFTITLTGMSAGTTGTANYAIGTDGKSVEFWIAASITGTSNAATMTGTGIPSAIQPVTAKRCIGLWEDNGGGAIGNVSVASASGTWTYSIGAQIAGGGFTTTGTKGLPAGSKINYALD